jgi:hypothetical protein
MRFEKNHSRDCSNKQLLLMKNWSLFY